MTRLRKPQGPELAPPGRRPRRSGWGCAWLLLAAAACSEGGDVDVLSIRGRDGCGDMVIGVFDVSKESTGGVVVRGTNLVATSVHLRRSGEASRGKQVQHRLVSASRLEVQLPEVLNPGRYNLAVANLSPACNASIAIEQGEPGELKIIGARLSAVVNRAIAANPTLRSRGQRSGLRVSTVAVTVGARSALSRSVSINGEDAILSYNTAGSIYLVVFDLTDHQLVDRTVAGVASTNRAYSGQQGAIQLSRVLATLSPDQLVIVVSTAGISAMSGNSRLAKAIAGLGGSSLFDTVAAEHGYALIGRPGLGPGNGIERVVSIGSGTARLATVAVDAAVLGFKTDKPLEVSEAPPEAGERPQTGCPPGQTMSWVDGAWRCQSPLTPERADFTISDQICARGALVTGVGPAGEVICGAQPSRALNEGAGAIALRKQTCDGDLAVLGVDDDGNAVCGTDLDSLLGPAIEAALVDPERITLRRLAQSGCAPGRVMKWDGASWNCGEDVAASGSDLGVTRVVGVGACPEGQVVAGINSAGQVVCTGDAEVASATPLPGTKQTCPEEGQRAIGIDANGNVICATDIWAVAPEEPEPGAGVIRPEDEEPEEEPLPGELGKATCPRGQVMQWNGLDWVCVADDETPIPGVPAVATGIAGTPASLNPTLPTAVNNLTAFGPGANICVGPDCDDGDEGQEQLSATPAKVLAPPSGDDTSARGLCRGFLVQGVCLVDYRNTASADWTTAVYACNASDAKLCSASQYYSLISEVDAGFNLFHSLRPLWTDDFSDNDLSRVDAARIYSEDDPYDHYRYAYGCCQDITPEPYRSQSVVYPALGSEKGVAVTRVVETRRTNFREAALACSDLGSDLCSKSQYLTLRDNGLFKRYPNVWTNEMSDSDQNNYVDFVGPLGDNRDWSSEFAYACCMSQRPIDRSCPGTVFGSVCTTRINNANDANFYEAARSCASDGADVCTKYQMQVLRNYGGFSAMSWTADGGDNDAQRAGGLDPNQPDDPHPASTLMGYACCL